MKTKYDSLASHQLISLANKNRITDEELNQEWYNRGGINYPYAIDTFGRIKNCVLDEIIKDEDCDRLILKQVNHVRAHLKRKREEMGLGY